LIFSPDRLMEAVDQLMTPETIPTAIKKMMTYEKLPTMVTNMMPSEKLPAALTQFMSTDSVAVLREGVKLGVRTWASFLRLLGWGQDHVDKVICHQVGAGHRDAILKHLGIPVEKDFSTYPYLGNIGTVSLPLTAALAEQRQFLKPGDRVGFLGIGSGLNCLMLGWQW
jgi:3-oxoacyl-[acyl-carrier-protein] synthase-3